MEERVKVLVFVGAAVTANCIPCMQTIYGMARDAGVSDREVAAAVRLGRKVRAGAAEKWDAEVEALLAGDRRACSKAAPSACGC